MDENFSAVLVAIITGGFGFLGILVTQWLSKAKARQLSDTKQATESSKQLGTDVIDHTAALSFHVRENTLTTREGLQEIKEDISEVRTVVQTIARELGI